MVECNHATLELLPARKPTLRCRRCHLTLGADEAAEGYCPECFERSGQRHGEFEELTPEDDGVSYRCEACGVVVKCP